MAGWMGGEVSRAAEACPVFPHVLTRCPMGHVPSTGCSTLGNPIFGTMLLICPWLGVPRLCSTHHCHPIATAKGEEEEECCRGGRQASSWGDLPCRAVLGTSSTQGLLVGLASSCPG